MKPLVLLAGAGGVFATFLLLSRRSSAASAAASIPVPTYTSSTATSAAPKPQAVARPKPTATVVSRPKPAATVVSRPKPAAATTTARPTIPVTNVGPTVAVQVKPGLTHIYAASDVANAVPGFYDMPGASRPDVRPVGVESDAHQMSFQTSLVPGYADWGDAALPAIEPAQTQTQTQTQSSNVPKDWQ